MEKKCVFVYEPTCNLIERRYDELYIFLLNNGLSLVGRCTDRIAIIDSDIIEIIISYDNEDVYAYEFDEIFEVPCYRDAIISRVKQKDGPPFAGSIYDYIDCLVSHVRGKGLPPGYFEQVASILKGGENSEDTGV